MSEAPHPRILFENVPEHLREPLRLLAGTYDFVDDVFDITDIHDSDWDLIVSFDDTPYVGGGMHALTFGARVLPSWEWGGTEVEPTRGEVLSARHVYTPISLDGEERRLLERTIVSQDPGPRGRVGLMRLPTGWTPLVVVGEEQLPWAALLDYGSQRVWALPSETTGHVEWLAFVLRALHETDQVRFPEAPDWRLADEWATPSVRSATAALASVEEQRQRALAELDREENSARGAVHEASVDAQAGFGRLLTEQSKPLEDAVSAVLECFGFGVQEMDEHHTTQNGAKLEDLRVSVARESEPDWTCLVEVKGYSKGAKANDVAQITSRPLLVFYKETGRDPDGLWHIVNSYREQDPSTRPVALTSAGDLAVLASAGGCFIDTRDLFRAWRDVEEGAVSADDVRASLMAGRERWEWPAKGSGS
ncbi:hypothetical protein [Curtobacterium flaccumfaciens]|uniref:hypothetical protein n=1 Tax=Curtobacterium flaccumfaciens TaxID=2035 RepID=UPI00220B3333|nr:hypothetical protein [Curtobacterium flaccumfaciens]MCS0470464.1 hypothetical protein [Curtobacterium flaccumfaciens pv. betae]MCS0473828.1 hypothetical protein [Curtobacterium flaccumfaciens pv. betae]MCS0478667.1 hypothetical protein [Curtobacterium flaccumfaciens pv. betae]MCS0480476.1 hypothetical protein [Curtobacterium flaccumfaciens pv. betae]MCS0484164.1 hypothetical protein [Curtobacterium flaccumfaciens pv. betae]